MLDPAWISVYLKSSYEYAYLVKYSGELRLYIKEISRDV